MPGININVQRRCRLTQRTECDIQELDVFLNPTILPYLFFFKYASIKGSRFPSRTPWTLPTCSSVRWSFTIV